MAFELMARVLHHMPAEVSTGARMVAVLIADAERSSAAAYPSIARLARMSGLSERAVSYALRELESARVIQTVRSVGYVNRYRVVLLCPPECDGSASHNRKAAETPAQPAPPPADSAPPPHRTTCTSPPAPHAAPPAPRAAEPVKEPVTEPVEQSVTSGDAVLFVVPGSPPAQNQDLDAAWNTFWRLYPRKVGRSAAQRVFLRAAAKVGPDVILDGVVRFANDPNLPEKQFIPHASTWLNQGRWEDEPYPPPRSSSSRQDDILRRERARISFEDGMRGPHAVRAIRGAW